MSNPVDDFLEYTKQAGLKDVANFARDVGKGFVGKGGEAASRGYSIGQQMQGGASGAVGAGLVAGVGIAAKKVYDAISKRQNFRQMFEVDPDLADVRNENPKLFNNTYTAFRNFNPTFAEEPLVAAHHMRRFMSMSGPDGAPPQTGLAIAQTVRPPQYQYQPGMSASIGVGPLQFRKGF